jgi:2'-5' RNA ligase
MKQIIRTFVAVETDLPSRSEVEQFIREVRDTSVNVSWVQPENRHLTLKFLGDVDLSDTYEVCQAVQRAVEGMEPFEMEVRGIGAFPDARRPRTLWMGAGEGAETMIALADRVEEQLHRLGYRREPRRFQPHLTLGRVRGGRSSELGPLLEKYADLEIGQISVDEVIVFSSTLERTGPIYDPIGRALLRAR